MEELTSKAEKKKRMKCPDCLNYMTATVHSNGNISGRCPVCKSMIFSKEPSEKERLIRIVKK